MFIQTLLKLLGKLLVCARPKLIWVSECVQDYKDWLQLSQMDIQI